VWARGTRGFSQVVRADVGVEFASRAYIACAQAYRLRHRIIEPGKPMRSGYIEGYFGNVRTGGSTTTGPRPCLRQLPAAIADRRQASPREMTSSFPMTEACTIWRPLATDLRRGDRAAHAVVQRMPVGPAAAAAVAARIRWRT
jgi:hypothetical protein